MKKVGLIVNNLLGGGAEKVVINLARMFQKFDVDVHIFILEDRIAYDIDGLTIHKILVEKEKKKFLKKNAKKLWAKALEEKIVQLEKDGIGFDALFSNLTLSDRVVVQIPSMQDKIYYIIHTTYSIELEELKKRKEYVRAYRRERTFKKLYKNKKLVCVSQGICNDLPKVGIHPALCKTIYNPFDLNEIRKKADEKPIDLPDEPYMIHVGAFRKEKRHDILLQAYAKLKNPPKLLLMCKEDDELQQMISDLHLEENVTIFGFKSNPYPYIHHAKLLVLSSAREGLPTVLVEALILRTPVVSTDCISGPNEILTGALSQYLAKVNDSTDLAFKIEDALKSYPSLEGSEYLEKFKEENVFLEYKALIGEN